MDYLTTSQRKALLKKITPQQQLHLTSILKRVCDSMIKKYVAGCLEHGGNLWEMPREQLLQEALNEALDQLTYLHTLKELNEKQK